MRGRVSRQIEMERKVDDIERRLREKAEIAAGFADGEVKARKLDLWFKHFDKSNRGLLTFQEFFAAMTKFNIVGVQREIEGLFTRYDDVASGVLNFKQLSQHLFGLDDKAVLTQKAKEIIENIKRKILERGGASGMYGLKRAMSRLEIDNLGTADRTELEYCLMDYGITTSSELVTLLDCFDRERIGRVRVEELTQLFKGGMTLERKQLCQEAFRKLDRRCNGCVAVEELLQTFDTSTHPNVAAGVISPEEAAQQMLANFEQGGDLNGVVTWPEFLDYYKTISLAIDDDGIFELMVRNAWPVELSQQPGFDGGSTCRRLLVTHSDGSQQVTEVVDDLGTRRFDNNEIARKLKSQGISDVMDVRY